MGIEMNIQCRYFRSWDDLDITLDIGKVNLIKGPSGIGKSTIFALIQWIIHGKVGQITPAGNPKAKTWGQLSMNGITITRSKNPRHLELQTQTSSQTSSNAQDLTHTLYEEEDAQEAINKLFGCPRIFSITSIVEQKERNSFLSMPNTDKLACLRSLSIGDEDPAQYLAVIDSKLEQANLLCDQLTTKHQYHNKKLAAMEDTSELLLTNVSTVTTQLQKAKDKLASHKQMQKENDKNDLMRTQYQQSVDSLEQNIENNSCTLVEIEEHEVTTLQQALVKQQTVIKLQAQLAKYPEQVPCPQFTMDQYKRAVQVEKTIKDHTAICTKYKIDYVQQAIADKLAASEQLLQAQDYIAKHKRYLDANDKLSNILTEVVVLPEPFTQQPPEQPEDIESMEQQVRDLQQTLANINANLELSQKTISCPHCSKGVVYCAGKLAASTSTCQKQTLVTQQKQTIQAIKQLQDKIQADKQLYQLLVTQYRKKETQHIQDMLRYEQARQTLSDKTNKLRTEVLKYQDYQEPSSQKELNPAQIAAFTKLISECSNIKVVSPPDHTSTYINQCMENNIKYAERIRIEAELHPLLEGYQYDPSLSKRVTTVVEQRKQYLSVLTKLQLLNQQLTKSKQQLQTVPANQATNIEKYKTLVQKLELDLTNHSKALSYIELRNKEQRKLTKLSEARLRRSRLTRLRKLITDTECDAYASTIASINACLADICQNLFPSLSASIQGYKDIKSTHSVKQDINLLINHNGETYNMKNLSGGEGDRVSFALTLSFLWQTNCPILMLDECFASLDNEMKMTVVSVLKQYTDCTVLVIQHDGIEGVYDEELDLEDYR